METRIGDAGQDSRFGYSLTGCADAALELGTRQVDERSGIELLQQVGKVRLSCTDAANGKGIGKGFIRGDCTNKPSDGLRGCVGSGRAANDTRKRREKENE